MRSTDRYSAMRSTWALEILAKFCSFCKSKLFEIREKTGIEKQRVITELRLHKLTGKTFFQRLKQKKPNTVTISFDMQQHQPLPKLSIGEVFYARQVWLSNLTIVHQTEDNTQATIRKNDVT